MNDRHVVSIFYRIAFPVALVLLAISLGVHLITFLPINVEDKFPPVFLLHLVIFILFIPLVFIDRVLPKTNSKSDIVPVWMRGCYLVIGAYVLFNFLYFLMNAAGNPEIDGGRYFLKNHGVVIRELTLQEYNAESARVLHGFSGHWLIFYFYIACSSYLGMKSIKTQDSTELK